MSQPWPFDPLEMFGYDAGMFDPPWPFDLWSNRGNEKSPAAQYECWPMERIMALPAGQLFRANAPVLLWCTWPIVALGLHAEVLRRWGMTPITGGDWAKRTRTGKLRWGTGYVLRSVCEPFIIARVGGPDGTKGRDRCNLIQTVYDDFDTELDARLIDGLARAHSQKPDEAYRLMEHLTPGARRCDVFARQRRALWESFGNELDKFPPEPHPDMLAARDTLVTL